MSGFNLDLRGRLGLSTLSTLLSFTLERKAIKGSPDFELVENIS